MERSPKNALDSSELPVEDRNGRKCRYSTLEDAKDCGLSYVRIASRTCANCCSLGRSDSVTVNPFSPRQITSHTKRKWMLAPAGPPAVDLDRARSEHTVGSENVFFPVVRGGGCCCSLHMTRPKQLTQLFRSMPVGSRDRRNLFLEINHSVASVSGRPLCPKCSICRREAQLKALLT